VSYIEGTTPRPIRGGSSGRQLKVARVGIVAYPRAGNTWRQADLVSDGGRTAAAQVHLTRIDAEGVVGDAGWDLLAAADWMIFGCSTRMCGPSSHFKTFADTTVRAWSPTMWRYRLAGRFANSTGMSGDKHSAVTYIWTVAMQQGMVWTGSGRNLCHRLRQGGPARQREVHGSYGGPMATELFDDAKQMARVDLVTAAAFGQPLAAFLALEKTPNTRYIDFTKN
jgi:NAD(P)H dehydrogenase (quinone)